MYIFQTKEIKAIKLIKQTISFFQCNSFWLSIFFYFAKLHLEKKIVTINNLSVIYSYFGVN